MKSRTLKLIFFIFFLIVCAVSGVMSMYDSLLTSWRYSLVCYVSFVFAAISGYLLFADSTWTVIKSITKPIKSITLDKQVDKTVPKVVMPKAQPKTTHELQKEGRRRTTKGKVRRNK